MLNSTFCDHNVSNQACSEVSAYLQNNAKHENVTTNFIFKFPSKEAPEHSIATYLDYENK